MLGQLSLSKSVINGLKRQSHALSHLGQESQLGQESFTKSVVDVSQDEFLHHTDGFLLDGHELVNFLFPKDYTEHYTIILYASKFQPPQTTQSFYPRAAPPSRSTRPLSASRSSAKAQGHWSAFSHATSAAPKL